MLVTFETDHVPVINMIGNAVCPRDWGVPFYKDYKTNEYELVFVYQGEAVFNIDDRPHKLDPGDCLLLTHDRNQSSKTVPENPCRFYFVIFTLGNKIERITEDAVHVQILDPVNMENGKGIRNFFIMPHTNFKRIYLPEKISLGRYKDEVFTIFEKALAERNHLTISSEYMITLYISQILVLLTRLTINNLNLDTLISSEGEIPQIVQEAIFYIHENYTNKLEANDICRHLGVSQQYLARLFQKSLGKSPLQYINQLRISHAKDLFRYSTLTMKEVSYAIGLNNPFYFSRLFKKTEGIAASDFKKGINSKSSV